MIWKSLLSACACGAFRFSKNIGPFCKKALDAFLNLLVSANTWYFEKKKNHELILSCNNDERDFFFNNPRSQNINQTPVQA